MSLVHMALAKKITCAKEQKLHSTQKLVLMLLADYAHEDTGVAWPAHSTVARDCGISLPTAKRVIGSLAELGLIEILQRKDERGVSLTNCYRMLFGGGVTGEGVGVHGRTGGRVMGEPIVGSPVNRGGVMGEPGVGSPVNPKQLLNSNELPENRKENTQSALDEQDAEEIYQEYPRKEGKPPALKAIQKALQRLRERAEADPKGFLLARVRSYKAWLAKQPPPPDGRDIRKMPQGWFNDHRYDDEHLQPAPKLEFIEVSPEEWLGGRPLA